jgi:hypothetical protein
MLHARSQKFSGASYEWPPCVVFSLSGAFSDEYTGGGDCAFSDYGVLSFQQSRALLAGFYFFDKIHESSLVRSCLLPQDALTFA